MVQIHGYDTHHEWIEYLQIFRKVQFHQVVPACLFHPLLTHFVTSFHPNLRPIGWMILTPFSFSCSYFLEWLAFSPSYVIDERSLRSLKRFAPVPINLSCQIYSVQVKQSSSFWILVLFLQTTLLSCQWYFLGTQKWMSQYLYPTSGPITALHHFIVACDITFWVLFVIGFVVGAICSFVYILFCLNKLYMNRMKNLAEKLELSQTLARNLECFSRSESKVSRTQGDC